MSNDTEFLSLRHWIGRQESREDVVTAAPAIALAATLDRPDRNLTEGSALPPLWHWLYFLPSAAQSDLGTDGHAARRGFLPSAPLPRRMWAASRLAFHRLPAVGERVRRLSTIADVKHKQGRSGDLLFVTVRHDIAASGTPAITEEQQIVYRASPSPGSSPELRSAGSPAIARDATERPPAFRDVVRPDPVLLFRYSALTFNGHRIHYDRPYATEVEAYPGLVVHGPLVATLLLESLHRHVPRMHVDRFDCRSRRPLFDTAEFFVEGRPDSQGWSLRAVDAAGIVAVEAMASTV